MRSSMMYDGLERGAEHGKKGNTKPFDFRTGVTTHRRVPTSVLLLDLDEHKVVKSTREQTALLDEETGCLRRDEAQF